jgi:hypothetical protein
MDKTVFITRLGKALAEERRKLLDQELKTDFAILKRQRIDESLPPKIYWALKCLPESVRVSYMKCLAENPATNSEACSKLRSAVFDFQHRNSSLVLMEWAKSPTLNPTVEQLENIKSSAAQTMQLWKETQYVEKLLKSCCKKKQVISAFRTCYYNTTGRRMAATDEAGVFADKEPLIFGDARIVVEWDCGGWNHFCDEIAVEWEGKRVTGRQSICSWLGYYPAGAGGWLMITKDDLEQAAHDAVQQTLQFRQILCDGVKKAIG